MGMRLVAPSYNTLQIFIHREYHTYVEFKQDVLRTNALTSVGLQVDMVMVPATSGQMGVLPGHVPTIAELKPGILSVHDGTEVKQYFVSSGFAFVHANSVADIVAIEAVPLDRFDPEEIRRGVQEFSQKMNTASTDLEKAEAQIGLEVHSALQAALGVTA